MLFTATHHSFTKILLLEARTWSVCGVCLHHHESATWGFLPLHTTDSSLRQVWFKNRRAKWRKQKRESQSAATEMAVTPSCPWNTAPSTTSSQSPPNSSEPKHASLSTCNRMRKGILMGDVMPTQGSPHHHVPKTNTKLSLQRGSREKAGENKCSSKSREQCARKDDRLERRKSRCDSMPPETRLVHLV